MLISIKKNFLFIHVCKVAGVSIENILKPYSNNNHPFVIINKLFKKINIENPIGIPKYKVYDRHAKARDIKKELPNDLYRKLYKFAFVRNPWDWQVSLYHFIKSSPDHFRYNLVKDMNFKDYLRWRVYEDKTLQIDFVTDENGQIIVDFIGRYENLYQDLKKVCKVLNIKFNYLPHLNKSKHDYYKKYYCKETRKIVERNFKEDIEFFKYTY